MIRVSGAVDISGFGGTHWGRIEGMRAAGHQQLAQAAQVFKDWGIATVTSLLQARSLKLDYELWGSGGLRSGLDTAKLLALGAHTIGFAKPILAAALNGKETLLTQMQQYEFELKMALFLSGANTIKNLQESDAWHLKTP